MLKDVAPALRRRLALLMLLFVLLITAGYLHDAKNTSATTSSASFESARISSEVTDLVPAAYVSMRAANQAAVAVYNSINAARRKAHLAPLPVPQRPGAQRWHGPHR
jgi:hypothetical protein